MHIIRSLVAAFATLSISLALGAPAVAAPAAPRPVDVLLHTSAGDIVLRLEPAKAPLTTRNFLSYVTSRAYDGGQFYRVIRSSDSRAPGVIQGGLGPTGAPKRAPIAVETTRQTGLHNVSGAISMARTSNPVSATSEFFICVGDDSYLDSEKSADGQGYAVFGHVVKGYDVVLKIQHAPAQGEALTPPIKILRARKL
jgi:peptidyl-prolyl cis-trans isomerase A (cyclophilin A)